MNFPEETLYYLLFFISPLLAFVSAVFVGFAVYEIINFFRSTLLTRLLIIIFVPAAFLGYFMHYLNRVFNFDVWLEYFLLGGGWEKLSFGDKFLITGPLILGTLYLAVKYILGWGGERRKDAALEEEMEDLEIDGD